MRCDACSVDIPPAWVAVIAKNECPSCSGKIMSNDTVELMNGLKTALEQMPNDPQGISGWLLSNYRMQKVGTGEPTGFIGTKNKSVQNSSEEIKIASTPLSKFQKLAGVKVENHGKYKAIMEEINSGLLDEDKDVQIQENEDYVPEADDINYTQNALKNMISSNVSKNEMRRVQNEQNDLNDEENAVAGLHPSLHSDRLNRLRKQEELSIGGVGKIKRAE